MPVSIYKELTIKPTYIDIKNETKLSLSTISKYFNEGNLKPANRKAIKAAVEKFDYKINTFAQALRSKSSKTIGLLLPELTSTFTSDIMSRLSEELRLYGYSVIMCDCNRDIEREKIAMEFLLDKMVDGIITMITDENGEHLKLAKHRKVPVILIDSVSRLFKTDGVIVNNKLASRLAVNKFAENNHKDIGIISGQSHMYTMDMRTKGFIEAMNDVSLPVRKEYILEHDASIEGGYNGVHKLLSLPNPPTALFCANYYITLGVIIAINELNIKIPDQLSIIGMGNLILAKIIKPKLTVVMQPMEQIAITAARLMLNRLSNDLDYTECNTIELSVSLVDGESIKKL